jgi:hypothetical protein
VHSASHSSSSCIRQHTSAYVSRRPHTSAYVSKRQHTCFEGQERIDLGAHTSAYVSIRQHTCFEGQERVELSAQRLAQQLQLHIYCTYISCIQLYTLHPAREVLKAIVLTLNQHASAYVSIRQHTSAYVNLHPAREVLKAIVFMLNHQHVEIVPKKLRPRERIQRPSL